MTTPYAVAIDCHAFGMDPIHFEFNFSNPWTKLASKILAKHFSQSDVELRGMELDLACRGAPLVSMLPPAHGIREAESPHPPRDAPQLDVRLEAPRVLVRARAQRGGGLDHFSPQQLQPAGWAGWVGEGQSVSP